MDVIFEECTAVKCNLPNYQTATAEFAKELAAAQHLPKKDREYARKMHSVLVGGGTDRQPIVEHAYDKESSVEGMWWTVQDKGVQWVYGLNQKTPGNATLMHMVNIETKHAIRIAEFGTPVSAQSTIGEISTTGLSSFDILGSIKLADRLEPCKLRVRVAMQTCPNTKNASVEDCKQCKFGHVLSRIDTELEQSPTAEANAYCDTWMTFAQVAIQSKATALRSNAAVSPVRACAALADVPTATPTGTPPAALSSQLSSIISDSKKDSKPASTNQLVPECGAADASVHDGGPLCVPPEHRSNYRSKSLTLAQYLSSNSNHYRAALVQYDIILSDLVGLKDTIKHGTTVKSVERTNWVEWDISGTGEHSACKLMARAAVYVCPGIHFTDTVCTSYPWTGKREHCPRRDLQCPVNEIDQQCIGEICADSQCPIGRLVAAFDTRMVPDSPSNCVAWFIKADAAIRIKLNYLRHALQLSSVRECFPWFVTGKPKFTGGCQATQNPGEGISTVHRRRGGGADWIAGCNNTKATTRRRRGIAAAAVAVASVM